MGVDVLYCKDMAYPDQKTGSDSMNPMMRMNGRRRRSVKFPSQFYGLYDNHTELEHYSIV